MYEKRAALLAPEIETEDDLLGARTYAYTGKYDFSHTCPYWQDILSLGIFGLKERLAVLAAGECDGEKMHFYHGCLSVFEAALRFFNRASEKDAAAYHVVGCYECGAEIEYVDP